MGFSVSRYLVLFQRYSPAPPRIWKLGNWWLHKLCSDLEQIKHFHPFCTGELFPWERDARIILIGTAMIFDCTHIHKGVFQFINQISISMKEQTHDYLIGVGYLETSLGFSTNNSIIEDKLVLVFSVHSCSTGYIVSVVLEQVQLFDDQMFFKDWSNVWRTDNRDTRDTGLANQPVRDSLGMVVWWTIWDINCNILWEAIVIIIESNATFCEVVDTQIWGQTCTV